MIRALAHVERFGEVERLVVARAVLGRPVYGTSAYLVDDVLIDSAHRRARRDLLG